MAIRELLEAAQFTERRELCGADAVVLEYDEFDGNVYDANGTSITMWPDLKHFGEPGSDTMKPRDLIALKEAGFTAEDLVTMRDGGVI